MTLSKWLYHKIPITSDPLTTATNTISGESSADVCLPVPTYRAPQWWGANTYHRASSTFFESQLCILLHRTGKELAETTCGSQDPYVFFLPPFSSFFGRQPWETHCQFPPPMTQGYEKLKTLKKKGENPYFKCLILHFKDNGSYVHITLQAIYFLYKVFKESLRVPTLSYFDFCLFKTPCPFFDKSI